MKISSHCLVFIILNFTLLCYRAPVALNRTLVLPRADRWWYTERSRCAQGGWDCYFQPVSSCHIEDTSLGLRHPFTLRYACQKSPIKEPYYTQK